ncbi:MAG: M48 family metalloprotease [Candidatus Nitrosotenuis sp.]
MGQVANGIAIFGVLLALIGAIILLIGQEYIKDGELETTTKTIAPGESFSVHLNMARFDKAICDLQSNSLADIIITTYWGPMENTIRNYKSFSGKFEFKNIEPRDYSGAEIKITNPIELSQGTVTYTIHVQQYNEQPSGYMTGFTLLLLGSLIAVFSAFKPDGKRLNHSFFKAKQLDTTFKMSTICLAFVGLVIIEIGMIAGLPPSVTSFFADAKNMFYLVFTVLAISIFPLAIFSYFVAPSKIERRWRLGNATKDAELQAVCDSLAKDAGLWRPPTVLITTASDATCFIFGISLRSYKLVISSRVKDALNQSELEAVISHELSHALHRDMIFMTWGEVYLSFAKFWALAILAGTILLAIFSSDIANSVLFISLFSLLGFGYSYFMINSISRDRELLSDIRSMNQTDSSSLRSALIKVKAIGAGFTIGNRLLFYSSLDESVSGFVRWFVRAFLATHPTLKQRVGVIDGTYEANMVSASNVIHIGLVAGFSYLFFAMTTQQISSRQEDSNFLLTLFPSSIIIGFLYGLYFAYQSVNDTFFDEDFNKRKKAIVVWISSVLSLILGNTLVFFVGLAIFLKFDWQQSLLTLVFGTFVFAMAFPLSLGFKWLLRHALK